MAKIRALRELCHLSHDPVGLRLCWPVGAVLDAEWCSYQNPDPACPGLVETWLVTDHDGRRYHVRPDDVEVIPPT